MAFFLCFTYAILDVSLSPLLLFCCPFPCWFFHRHLCADGRRCGEAHCLAVSATRAEAEKQKQDGENDDEAENEEEPHNDLLCGNIVLPEMMHGPASLSGRVIVMQGTDPVRGRWAMNLAAMPVTAVHLDQDIERR